MTIIAHAVRPDPRRKVTVLFLFLFVVAALDCLLWGRRIEAQVKSVEDWASQPLNVKGAPVGWSKLFLFSANVETVAQGGEQVLRLKSASDHSIIARAIGAVDLAATPVLEWKWRVDELPRGANLKVSEQSDSAVEIHLVWEASKRTLGYAWDETLPVGDVFPSPRKSGVNFLIVTSGKARPGEWIAVTRNVVDDHMQVFKTKPAGPPDQIAISIDSNQTRSSAEAFIGAIRFRAP